MSDLFAGNLHPAPPQEHYCLLCERRGSFGVKLRRPPSRDGGRRRGDGAFGYTWYCAEHAEVGRAALRRERALA